MDSDYRDFLQWKETKGRRNSFAIETTQSAVHSSRTRVDNSSPRGRPARRDGEGSSKDMRPPQSSTDPRRGSRTAQDPQSGKKRMLSCDSQWTEENKLPRGANPQGRQRDGSEESASKRWHSKRRMRETYSHTLSKGRDYQRAKRRVDSNTRSSDREPLRKAAPRDVYSFQSPPGCEEQSSRASSRRKSTGRGDRKSKRSNRSKRRSELSRTSELSAALEQADSTEAEGILESFAPGITKGLPADEIIRLLDISKKLPGWNAEAKKRVDQRKCGSGISLERPAMESKTIGEDKLQENEKNAMSPIQVVSESPSVLQGGKGEAAPERRKAIQVDKPAGTPKPEREKEYRTVGTQMLHSPIHPLIARASVYTPLSWDDVSELSAERPKTPGDQLAACAPPVRDLDHLVGAATRGECGGEKDPMQGGTAHRRPLDPNPYAGVRTVLTDSKGKSCSSKVGIQRRQWGRNMANWGWRGHRRSGRESSRAPRKRG